MHTSKVLAGTDPALFGDLHCQDICATKRFALSRSADHRGPCLGRAVTYNNSVLSEGQ